MLRRKTWRQQPVFWAYLIVEVVRAALLFTIGNDKSHYFTYFYVYSTTEILVCLLGFFVIAELFRQAFSQRLGLLRWGKALFRSSLLCLIVLAVLTASSTHGSEASKLVAGILLLKRVESLVRMCLVIALFVFVSALGLPWTSYTVGIATGFAVYGAIEFCGVTARLLYSSSLVQVLTWMIMIAAFCQNTVWAAYFIPPRKRSDASVPVSPLDSSTLLAELVRARAALQMLRDQ
ncbi:MAG TPA: hypothetical protein VM912_23200 [Terriglobales bacterium]|nr:hypothetical protein [Terriglobales bacterium]